MPTAITPPSLRHHLPDTNLARSRAAPSLPDDALACSLNWCSAYPAGRERERGQSGCLLQLTITCGLSEDFQQEEAKKERRNEAGGTKRPHRHGRLPYKLHLGRVLLKIEDCEKLNSHQRAMAWLEMQTR